MRIFSSHAAKDVAALERKKTVQVHASNKMYIDDLFPSLFSMGETGFSLFHKKFLSTGLIHPSVYLAHLFPHLCCRFVPYLHTDISHTLKEHLAELTDEQQLLPYTMILFNRAPEAQEKT
jgi:hypothetical protein